MAILIDYSDLKTHEAEFANIYIESNDSKKYAFHKCNLVKNKWFKDNILDGSVEIDKSEIKLPFVGSTINRFLNWLSNAEFRVYFKTESKNDDNYQSAKELFRMAHFINDIDLQNICIDILTKCKNMDNDLIAIFKKHKMSMILLYEYILNGHKSISRLSCYDFIDECVTYGINQKKYMEIMLHIIPYYHHIKRDEYILIVNSIVFQSVDNPQGLNHESIKLLIQKCNWVIPKSGSYYLKFLIEMFIIHDELLRKQNDSLMETLADREVKKLLNTIEKLTAERDEYKKMLASASYSTWSIDDITKIKAERDEYKKSSGFYLYQLQLRQEWQEIHSRRN